MMFGLLIREYEYGSSKVTETLYHKIYASQDDAFSGARSLMSGKAKTLNHSSTQRDNIAKFMCVDYGYTIGNTDDFDAAVIFVDGKYGIHSENDATIKLVTSAKVVKFIEIQ